MEVASYLQAHKICMACRLQYYTAVTYMWAGEPHLHVLTRVFARAQPVVTAVKTEKHQPIRDCGHGRLCQSCVCVYTVTHC